jgi:hypothetical protein
MIKLKKLLSEIILKEFNKSQTDFISTKLNISNNDILNSLLNKLNSQGITYSSIKLKILSGDIKNLKDLEKLKVYLRKMNYVALKTMVLKKCLKKEIYLFIYYTLGKLVVFMVGAQNVYFCKR